MITGLKKIFGLYNIEDKLSDYNDLKKAEQNSIDEIDSLAEQYNISQQAFNEREKFDAEERDRIEERHMGFMKAYWEDLKKARKNRDIAKEKRERLFKDPELSNVITLERMYTALDKIQKSDLSKAHKDILIQKVIGETIKKSKSGFYKDNASNRRAGIVGMPYGIKHTKGGVVKEEKGNQPQGDSIEEKLEPNIIGQKIKKIKIEVMKRCYEMMIYR